MRMYMPFLLSLFVLHLASVGCQPVGPGVYLADPVVEIGPDGEKILGNGAQYCENNPDCDTKGEFCNAANGGPTDIVRNKDKVVAVLCYPDATKQEDVIQADGPGIGTVNGNGRIVTFGPSTDGTPLEGDVSLQGNNNVLYGNGPGATVLKGDVQFNGNNGRTRSLTIQGNLTLQGNNFGVVRVVVEGDLIVRGNNSVFADVVVFGRISIEGNNHSLLLVRAAGDVTLVGKGFACTDTYRFQDDSKDGIFQPAEQTETFSCPK
ncbi:MAG: hypothetical protein H6727_05740 [Myxococcales bacterium]|nr:hypothetical protein [Myxococcales bacterium]